MEKIIYESKPYFYGLVAVFALYFGKGSLLMTLSGIFMGLACISVGMLRYDFRNAVAMPRKGKASRRELEGESHLGQKRFHIE